MIFSNPEQSCYQMTFTSLWWRHLVNACDVKAHLIGLFSKLGAVCFWQPIPSGLNLVVAAVLRDSLWAVSLLSCVADRCMLYTACKVERFVLTILKADYYYYYYYYYYYQRRPLARCIRAWNGSVRLCACVSIVSTSCVVRTPASRLQRAS